MLLVDVVVFACLVLRKVLIISKLNWSLLPLRYTDDCMNPWRRRYTSHLFVMCFIVICSMFYTQFSSMVIVRVPGLGSQSSLSEWDLSFLPFLPQWPAVSLCVFPPLYLAALPSSLPTPWLIPYCLNLFPFPPLGSLPSCLHSLILSFSRKIKIPGTAFVITWSLSYSCYS